ncbi:hypothetical protein D3C74_291170 [compost metagenome]
MADQVAGVLEGEEILPGGDGVLVVLGQRGVQRVVQRIADFFVPEQIVLIDGLAVFQRGFEIEFSVDIHHQAGSVTIEDFQDSFDALDVIGEVSATDFHLDDVVACVQESAHLVLQVFQCLARGIVAAGGVDKDVFIRVAIAVMIGDPPV